MIIPVSKSLSMIAPEKPVYPYSNCLYIEDDCPTLIDLGAGGNAIQAIAKKEIALCLISHSHFDHLHGEPLFEQTRLMAGNEEAQVYTDENVYNDFHGYSLWNELTPYSCFWYPSHTRPPLTDYLIILCRNARITCFTI